MGWILILMFAAWLIYAWRDSRRKDKAIDRIRRGGK